MAGKTSKTKETIEERQKQWEASLAKWNKEYGERRKQFTHLQGRVPVKALYTPLDGAERGFDFLRDVGYPGEFPFTRGNETSMYRRQYWEMSQYSGFGSASETNKRIKELFDRGLSGIFIAMDLPTQIGYDSDNTMARKEVGKVGVAISSMEDMERIFEGIDLSKLSSVKTTANAIAPVWMAFMLGVCEKRGINPNSFHVCTQNDILKEFASRGTQIFPLKPSLKFATDLLEYCAKNLPTWSPLQFSGEHMMDMGGRQTDSMAFALSNAIQYYEYVLERGVDIDEIAPKNEILIAGREEDFFGDIAKFRASRRMWARIMKDRFHAKNPESMKLHMCGFGAGAPLLRQEPLNNIVRITLESLACALGGTESQNLPSFDEALCTPSADAARVAMRTQQIIAYESGVADTIDPLAGSFFVEYLTDEFEKETMAMIAKVDKKGGAAAAIEEGFFQQTILQAAYEYQKGVESGDIVRVGLNKFAQESHIPWPAFKGNPEEEENQKKRLKELRARRDNRAVRQTLGDLKVAAKKSENVMPYLIKCAREYATIGEIFDTMREVWGEFHARSQIF
ncbi:MAG: methylmalonyl-CoA mutase family protein [Dehalococcoidales bacterium]|nr:methylmalonyl-CoA mutase family protein [Dehalococcoidales bacterium]